LQTSEVEATVYLNGAKVARGWDEAVLDDPVNSVVWLTGKLNQFGVGLRAGDLIMTGSFVRPFPLSPGDRVRADFTGVGVVEAEIAPA
jgi:2-keto-4-pentenoate hydratase